MKLKNIILILIIILSPKIVLGQNDSLKKGAILKLQNLLKLKEQKFYEFKGKKLPDFKLNSSDGKIISSESLKGKPTIIIFWFIECHHCIEEIPALNRIKNKFGNEVNFISMTYNKKEDVNKFLKSTEFKFRHIVNAKEYLSNFGFSTYPKMLILDKNLTIVEVGDKRTTETKIMDKLTKLKNNSL